jgi:neutral trehalase
VAKKEFPGIHFYDQDFVDLYDQTWAWMEEYNQSGNERSGLQKSFFNDPAAPTVNQLEACFNTFFMVYSNKKFAANPQLDNFYLKQEENGAIRCAYFIEDGKPVLTPDNPDGVSMPLFAWAEYNLYHKIGNKKRIKEVMPILEKYFEWLEATFKHENGLYAVPLAGTSVPASPRAKATYFIDFNAAQAVNALYLSELGEILNDKEISFKYKRHYFSLKTKINQLFWNDDSGLYYDLDVELKQVPVKTLATFWTLLAEIPNEAKTDLLIPHLKNPDTFGTPHPFPSLGAKEPCFHPDGHGPHGSVYPHLTFMIIKGLEKFGFYELARESAIRHLYYMLDTLHPEGNKRGSVWEAYKPNRDGHSEWPEHPEFPRVQHLHWVGLSTIALMIENVIGLYISLPKKTVDWKVPTIEAMGIENLSLKRNMVTILSNKTNRGWEIRLESEKLYYFTIDILSIKKKKTLPIPSGKCSMLIDKL